MSKGSFDIDLEKQLKDKEFKERFERADRALDISIKLQELIDANNDSDKELAEKLSLSLKDIKRLREGEFSNFSQYELDNIYKIITSPESSLSMQHHNFETHALSSSSKELKQMAELPVSEISVQYPPSEDYSDIKWVIA